MEKGRDPSPPSSVSEWLHNRVKEAEQSLTGAVTPEECRKALSRVAFHRELLEFITDPISTPIPLHDQTETHYDQAG